MSAWIWSGATRAGVELAAARLRAGQLVAFPTETVYGLGANGRDATAVAQVYAAKGRPLDNPLIYHVAEPAAVREVAAEIPEAAARLMRAFWPGPLTLVLPARAGLPAARRTVAVRVPDHPLARALLRAAQRPVVAPSANRSGRPSPTTATHVAQDLADWPDLLILDGGACAVGVESTVVDLTRPHPEVLRLGGLALEDLERALGRPVAVAGSPRPGEELRSPGLRYRHYAPQAELWVFVGSAEDCSAALRRVAEEARGPLRALGSAAFVAAAGDGIALPPAPEVWARQLFSALRVLDAPGTRAICAELPPDVGLGRAVRSRLLRAATRVIDAGQVVRGQAGRGPAERKPTA